MDELYKVVQIENSKRAKQSAKEKRAQKAKEQKIKQEAEKKVEVIREKKKEQKQKAVKIEAEKPKIELRIGDRVRLPDGRATGTLDKIEKGKATVNYGMFTTQVDLDTLEFVLRPKK